MTEDDKAQNFRRLEHETEKWKARAEVAEAALDASPTDDGDNAELEQWKARSKAAEEAAHRGVLLEAGFDPSSGEAKALLRDLASGEVEADPAAVVARFRRVQLDSEPADLLGKRSHSDRVDATPYCPTD